MTKKRKTDRDYKGLSTVEKQSIIGHKGGKCEKSLPKVKNSYSTRGLKKR